MARPPLAKGDDGSGNRYPIRTVIGRTYDGNPVTMIENDPMLPHCVRHNHHNCQSPACIGLPGAVADPRCSACVPDALQAPKCELCGARDWAVDHIGGDDTEPLACPTCAFQHGDAS